MWPITQPNFISKPGQDKDICRKAKVVYHQQTHSRKFPKVCSENNASGRGVLRWKRAIKPRSSDMGNPGKWELSVKIAIVTLGVKMRKNCRCWERFAGGREWGGSDVNTALGTCTVGRKVKNVHDLRGHYFKKGC